MPIGGDHSVRNDQILHEKCKIKISGQKSKKVEGKTDGLEAIFSNSRGILPPPPSPPSH